jgi:thiol-disulfide isomerase/thioredoxin
MAKFLSVLDNIVKPYYNRLFYLFVIVLFSIVGYYAYQKYYVKQRSGFTDVANANRNNKTVTVHLFHVDWCPHCKKALPDWEIFKSKYNEKEVNGYTVEVIDTDCTNESSDITATINKFNIEAYPTVKMEKDGNIIDFDSKISSTTLEQFIESMLN